MAEDSVDQRVAQVTLAEIEAELHRIAEQVEAPHSRRLRWLAGQLLALRRNDCRMSSR